MKFKNQLIVVLLFSIIYCFGQIEEKEQKQRTDDQTGRVEIYLAPTSYLNIRLPRIRVGAQYYFHPKLCYSLDLAYGETKMSVFQISNFQYNVFEIRPAFKFTPTRKRYFLPYVGIEGLYYQANGYLQNTFYKVNNGQKINFDEAEYLKVKYSLFVIIGVKFFVKNRISFDLFVGPGVARRNTRYFNVENPIINTDIEEWVVRPKEGIIDGIDLTLGFKVGIFLN